MSESNKTGYRGPSFLSLLALLFIGLRLAGFIDWPWWIVLAPIWVILAVMLVCFLALGVISYVELKNGRR